MPVHKISAGIGHNRKNKPEDVAFVQLALKVIPIGPYNNFAGKRYFTGKIDGKFSVALRRAIGAFKDTSFSEKDWKDPTLLSEPLDTISSAYSKSYKKLVNRMPSEYWGGKYRFGVSNQTVIIFNVPQSSKAKAKYSLEDLALPKREAEGLLKILNAIIGYFNIIPIIKKITIGHRGFFRVNISLQGGKVANANTGKLVRPSQYALTDIQAYIQSLYGTPILPNKDIWRLVSEKQILLKSKKSYSFAVLDRGDRTFIRYQLGAVKNFGYEEDVIATSLDIYERARIGGELTSDMLTFMKEIYGKEWQKFKYNESIRKKKASALKGHFTKILNDVKQVRDSLLFVENKFRKLQDIDVKDTVGSLVEDVSAIFGGKLVSKKISRGLTKAGRKQGADEGAIINRGNNKKETSLDVISESIGGTIGVGVQVVIDPPSDTFDNILLHAGIAALVVGLVAATILTGGAATAVVAGGLLEYAAVASVVATTTSNLVFWGEVAKTGYNLLSNILFNQGLEEELALLESEIIPAQRKLANKLAILGDAFKTAQTEGYFLLADFGFSKEEISKNLISLKAALE